MSGAGNTFRAKQMLGCAVMSGRPPKLSSKRAGADCDRYNGRGQADRGGRCRLRSAESGALLVEWLNAIIYEIAARKMVFSRFSVAIRREANRAKVG